MISSGDLNASDVKGIVSDLGGLGGPALVAAVVGGIIGYMIAVAIDELPAAMAVTVGMVVGLAIAVGAGVAAAPTSTTPICRYDQQSCRSMLPVLHPLG